MNRGKCHGVVEEEGGGSGWWEERGEGAEWGIMLRRGRARTGSLPFLFGDIGSCVVWVKTPS